MLRRIGLALAIVSALVFANIAYAAVTVSAPNSNGLVGYWSFNEGTSTLAHDFSGHGNTGTLSGTTLPTWTAGKLGQALKFNGSTSYVTASNVSVGNSFTASAWVKAAAWPQINGTRILEANGAGRGNTFGLVIANGATGVSSAVNNTLPATGVALTAGVWKLVTVTYDGTTEFLYANGALISSKAVTTAGAGSHTMGIGTRGNTPGTLVWNGTIDDVRIYNRALSAQEVKQLYQSGTANINHSGTANINHSNTVALSNGLVGYWTFDGGATHWNTGKTDDVSGEGNTGTLVGMSTTTSPVAGKIGQALKFNGSSSYIAGPTLTLTPGSFAVSAWFKTTSTADKKIVSNDLTVDPLAIISGFIRTCWIGCAVGTHSIADGKWHFAVAVSTTSGSSQLLTVYLDGNTTPEASISSTLSPVSGPLKIGASLNGALAIAYFFPGTIDDVRIYNRALSWQELQQLYLMGK